MGHVTYILWSYKIVMESYVLIAMNRKEKKRKEKKKFKHVKLWDVQALDYLSVITELIGSSTVLMCPVVLGARYYYLISHIFICQRLISILIS